jgi:MoaA/NifB/PqqE/SkfB family radical SAM enzyme
MYKPEIKLIHLQLTQTCNLRCSFCGQWGKNGYMHNKTPAGLSESEWLNIVDQAVDYRKQSGISPEFIIWGGEPLLNPSFTKIANYLKENNFKTSLVTNGILLEKFAPIVNSTIDTVFVSLDGPEEVHEKLRGRKGIYETITKGLNAIDKKNINLINLFTICEDNFKYAAEFPFSSAKLGFHKIIFQNLIYCSAPQAAEYKKWIKDSFELKAKTIDSWIRKDFGDWTEKLGSTIESINANKPNYGIEAEIFPHEITPENISLWFDPEVKLKKSERPCMMPYRHMQIKTDGNVHLCVDFCDFSLGNIKDKKLTELFNSKAAEKFRKEYTSKCSICNHCPWFYNKNIK